MADFVKRVGDFLLSASVVILLIPVVIVLLLPTILLSLPFLLIKGLYRVRHQACPVWLEQCLRTIRAPYGVTVLTIYICCGGKIT